ncbi:MAG: TetR/AcrR family transcriptional regulator [Hyphomonadaceae bacterium]
MHGELSFRSTSGSITGHGDDLRSSPEPCLDLIFVTYRRWIWRFGSWGGNSGVSIPQFAIRCKGGDRIKRLNRMARQQKLTFRQQPSARTRRPTGERKRKPTRSASGVQTEIGNEDPRERILSAARQVFLDGPPEQATMDAVAHLAGMSKKTIYREFKSQFELLATLLAESAPDIGAFPPPPAGSDIEVELYGMLVRLVTQITSPRAMALVRLIISEIRRYPDLAERTRDGKGNFPVEIIASWLRSKVVREQLDIHDPEEAASMLMGMVMQDAGFKLLLISDCGSMDPHVIEKRARRAVSIFLRGVRKGY